MAVVTRNQARREAARLATHARALERGRERMLRRFASSGNFSRNAIRFPITRWPRLHGLVKPNGSFARGEVPREPRDDEYVSRTTRLCIARDGQIVRRSRSEDGTVTKSVVYQQERKRLVASRTVTSKRLVLKVYGVRLPLGRVALVRNGTLVTVPTSTDCLASMFEAMDVSAK